MTTRTIQGRIKRPNGAPWAEAKVFIEPTHPTYRTSISPPETYPRERLMAVADAAGGIEVTLVSGPDKEYRVIEPNRDTYTIVVLDGGLTTLEELRAASSPPSVIPTAADVVNAVIGTGAAGEAWMTIPDELWYPSNGVGGKTPRVWLRSDSIIGLTDGQGVSSWASTVNGLVATQADSDPTAYPTYQTNEVGTLPVVRSDGVNDDLRIHLHGITKPCIVAWIGKHNGGGNVNGRVTFATNFENRVFRQTNRSRWILSDGTTDIIYSDQPTTQLDPGLHVHVLIYNGAASRGSYDGALGVTGTLNTSPPGDDLEFFSDAGTGWLPIDMLQWIAIPIDTLGTDQIETLRQQLEGYLAHYGGIQNQLVYGHPYAIFPPATSVIRGWHEAVFGLDTEQTFIRSSTHRDPINRSKLWFTDYSLTPNWDFNTEMDGSLTNPESTQFTIARQMDVDIATYGFGSITNMISYQTNSGDLSMQGIASRIMANQGSGIGSTMIVRGNNASGHAMEIEVGSQESEATATATNGSAVLTNIVPQVLPAPRFEVGLPVWMTGGTIAPGTTIASVVGRPGSPTSITLSNAVSGLSTSPGTVTFQAGPGAIQTTVGMLITGNGARDAARGGGNPAGVALSIQAYNSISAFKTLMSISSSALLPAVGKVLLVNTGTQGIRVVSVENTAMTGDLLYFTGNTAANTGLRFEASNSFGTGAIYLPGQNIATDGTTGMKVATSATQKLGFFGATPIIRPGATNGIKASLVSLGLITGSGATPLDLNGGTLTAGAILIGTDAALSAASVITMAVPFTIEGSGSVILPGIKGDIEFPVASTLTKVELFADQNGSIVIDLWRDTYANYAPTVADTIVASAKPTISSTNKSTDSTLTGWSKSCPAGSILRINVDSCTSITRCTMVLTYTRVLA